MERLGPRSCLIDAATGRTICPEDLPRRIAAYGASLRSTGLREGDRVLIGCSLSLPSALVYLGAMYTGLVAVPVEDRAVDASAAALVEATGAKAVWTEAGSAWRHRGRDSILYLHGDLSKKSPKPMPPAPRVASDLAALMATSGSTGVPRFVMVSHGNLIANTEAIIRSQRLAGDERAMMILPVSYCFGASLLHTHLYAGGGVVFDRRFMFPDKVLAIRRRLRLHYLCRCADGLQRASSPIEYSDDHPAAFEALSPGRRAAGPAENRGGAGDVPAD